MANAAAKKQAVANNASLKTLHTMSLVFNGLFILSYLILSRPRSIKPYLIFSIPAFFLEYQIEKMGRPVYDSEGSLLRSGADLSQAGLTEWFHDVIYVTFLCDLLAVITGRNKVWYLYSIIPLYASYKAWGLFKGLKSGFGGGSNESEQQQTPQAKSKRQEKLEKRGGVRNKYM